MTARRAGDRYWPKGEALFAESLSIRTAAFGETSRLGRRTVLPDNALYRPLDPARLALPLQAVCVKCG